MVDRDALYRVHRLAVVGSRKYPDKRIVQNYISTIRAINPDCVIVSGGAPGPDTWAVAHAERCGLATHVIEPEKDPQTGKWVHRGAGLERNTKIVSASDGMLAFHDLVSTGTADSIRKARRKGIPVLVIGPDGEEVEAW